MKCPACGAEYDAPHRYCGNCGAMLEPEQTGSHRWPLILLAALALAGLLLWFATPHIDTEPVQPMSPTAYEQSF